ncbi:MAG: HNH endonuclease [Rickettsiales bacterium]|jgi:hypothetical protein|nr:HNH endonuclease [Rickettsiales bacterium]
MLGHTFDVDDFIKKIDLEVKDRREKNRAIVRDYFKNIDMSAAMDSYPLEVREMLDWIYLGVSKEYISKLYDIDLDKLDIHVPDTKNQTYHENARLFARSQKIAACERFNYICPMCFQPLDIRKTDTITGHHIIPYSLGGITNIDNCLPLHVSCHFEEFKILHESLFGDDILYSWKYYNDLRFKINRIDSGLLMLEKITKKEA